MGIKSVSIEDLVECLRKQELFVEAKAIDPKSKIDQIQTDSRAKTVANTVFIAIKGNVFDSHQCIDKLQNSDCCPSLFLVDNNDAYLEVKNRPVIKVQNSRAAWSFVSALLAGNPQEQLTFYGITGTNGKTSSAWLLRQLLASLGEKVLMIGTLGIFSDDEIKASSHTTPDPDILFSEFRKALSSGVTTVVMEVSSHAIAQKKVEPIQFDAVLFTSFSRDHLDFHSSMQDYLQTKVELYQRLAKSGAKIVLESKVEAAIRSYGLSTPSDYTTYGLPHETRHSDVTYTLESVTSSGTRFGIMSTRDTGVQIEFTTALFGNFIIANLVGCLVFFRDKWQEIQTYVSKLESIPGRLEPVKNSSCPAQVFIDYAHTPDALDNCLSSLSGMTKNRLFVVFGCGGDRDKGKRPQMAQVAVEYADTIMITSDNPRTEDPLQIIKEIYAGIPSHMTSSKIYSEEDRKKAIETVMAMGEDDDVILIAGKGHEEYQIIGNRRLPFSDKSVVLSFQP